MRGLFVIVFLICSICVRAQVVEIHEYESHAEGKKYNYEVFREQLLKTPAWHIDDDRPPLSPRAAERAAKKEFEKRIKDTTHWTEDRIILVDMGDKIHWIYLVQYRRFAERVEDAQLLRIVVLMDGTVVEPKISDDK